MTPHGTLPTSTFVNPIYQAKEKEKKEETPQSEERTLRTIVPEKKERVLPKKYKSTTPRGSKATTERKPQNITVMPARPEKIIGGLTKISPPHFLPKMPGALSPRGKLKSSETSKIRAKNIAPGTINEDKESSGEASRTESSEEQHIQVTQSINFTIEELQRIPNKSLPPLPIVGEKPSGFRRVKPASTSRSHLGTILSPRERRKLPESLNSSGPASSDVAKSARSEIIDPEVAISSESGQTQTKNTLPDPHFKESLSSSEGKNESSGEGELPNDQDMNIISSPLRPEEQPETELKANQDDIQFSRKLFTTVKKENAAADVQLGTQRSLDAQLEQLLAQASDLSAAAKRISTLEKKREAGHALKRLPQRGGGIAGETVPTSSIELTALVKRLIRTEKRAEDQQYRALNILFCAAGGNNKLPKTEVCADVLAKLPNEARSEYLDALYEAINQYLSPAQQESISYRLQNIRDNSRHETHKISRDNYLKHLRAELREAMQID